MDIGASARANMDALRQNAYPGRGIVIGLTPDGRNYVQVYWIMGRNENSRNRIFVQEGDLVRTAPYDESKVKEPSLIIYNCVRSYGRCHVVSNGDQTDTLFDAMQEGRTFEDALSTRSFEPDAPNFTPRVSGVVDLDDEVHAYRLSVIKAIDNDPHYCIRHFSAYETAVPGVGHCIHTYADDGSPLPCFEGEPYPVELLDDIGPLAQHYWDIVNEDNKISLLVKFIDAETGAAEVKVINKHTAD